MSQPLTSSVSSWKIPQSACTPGCQMPSPKLPAPLLGGFWCFFLTTQSLLVQPGLEMQLSGAAEAGACQLCLTEQ